jgi:DNA-directed RNA polymerase sigma subunit (sigma70/sigma32)
MKRLTPQQKQKIFHALVTTQDVALEHSADLAATVRKSYEIVAEQFEISSDQLRQIEDEGLEKQWPPLSEAVQEVG